MTQAVCTCSRGRWLRLGRCIGPGGERDGTRSTGGISTVSTNRDPGSSF